MRWDDWLFIVMFFGVVPGAITLLGRRLSNGGPWRDLTDATSDTFPKAAWTTVFRIEIITATSTTTLKNLSRVSIVDGHFIVRPGIFARFLGFSSKSIPLKRCSFNRSSGMIRIRTDTSSFQMKLMPGNVAAELFRR